MHQMVGTWMFSIPKNIIMKQQILGACRSQSGSKQHRSALPSGKPIWSWRM